MMLIPLAVAGSAFYVGLRTGFKGRAKKNNLVKAIVITSGEGAPLVPAIDHEAEVQAKEAELNHYFKVSTVTVALSVATSVLYPPLSILTAIGLAYSSIPFVKGAYQAWTQERKINVNFIDAILFGGVILTQRYLAGAFSVWIFLFSEKLLLETQDSSQKKLVSVFNEQPRKVWLQQGTVEVEIPFERLQVGDIIVVNTGETIPIDGVITEGLALLDQHVLTGESKPVEKSPGDKVFAATIVLAGRLLIQVEQTGEQTVTAQIGKIFNQTADWVGQNPWIESPFYCDYGRHIFLGDEVYMNMNCMLIDCHHIEIGSQTFLGPSVQIYTATHPTDPEQRNLSGSDLAYPVRIGARSWIGGGAIILPGVTIGDNTTIGAGSVVTHDIPSSVVAVGNPCRIIRYI